MLIIPCTVDRSAIHGMGLYADEDIPKGTTVWVFNKNFDLRFSRDDFIAACSGLNSHALLNLLTYTYKRNNYFYYVTDNARFINHSEKDFNIIFKDDFTEVSSKDIRKGEELLENYILNYDSDDYFFHEETLSLPEEYITKISQLIKNFE